MSNGYDSYTIFIRFFFPFYNNICPHCDYVQINDKLIFSTILLMAAVEKHIKDIKDEKGT